MARLIWAMLGLVVLAAAGPEELAQGWTQTEGEVFRNSPVGSRVVPYDLFVRLEVAEGEGLFAAPGHLASYGYVVVGANPTNPDGLPAGFARERDTAGRLWLGMSCAACHTGSLTYRGRTVLVDGGAGLADTQRFDRELTAALGAVADDAAKLERLAVRLGVSAAERPALRARVLEAAAVRAGWSAAMASVHAAGPGRLDLAGQAAQAVGVGRGPEAPVRIPWLWNAGSYANGMRDGSVVNAGAGPLLRDAAQVVGAYGSLGEVSFPDLLKVEALLRRLSPPVWPEDVLPPIDRARAERGAAVFRQVCAGCHGMQARGGDGLVATPLLPMDQVGTDRLVAGARWRAVMGPMEGALPGRLQAGLAAWRAAAAAAATRRTDVLRAAPLAGVWAGAPFLHDGSVANLAELLTPPEARARRFTVGGSEFDPVLVGYPADVTRPGFVFDTTLPGNSASGHDYGTGLAPEVKVELIEFLKTL